jgi:hypothetical protein
MNLAEIPIHGDLLYVNTSNGVEWTHSKVVNPAAPSLIVLDKRTGKLVAVHFMRQSLDKDGLSND